jgi:hypothetical protein
MKRNRNNNIRLIIKVKNRVNLQINNRWEINNSYRSQFMSRDRISYKDRKV